MLTLAQDDVGSASARCTRAPASACTSTTTTRSHVLSGRGRYILDSAAHDVVAGDALLTRTGSTHSIQQAGDEDLVLLIVYLSVKQASGR